MIPEFSSFGKIAHIGKMFMSITQKLHGTNAQIYIYETENGLDLICGCRTRWIYPWDDNFGFANFVHANKQEFIEKLGPGRHFGEWTGPGVNNGEGLSEKRLYLFNWERWSGQELPIRTNHVPLLYKGPVSMDAINSCMEQLKQKGSYICPGYMKPEGIVINIGGVFYKKVFDPEETQWVQKEKKERVVREEVDISHLLQPIRLQKILSSDESYLRDYPQTIGAIVSHYVRNLEEEPQLMGNEDEVKAYKKALGRKVFDFVKTIVGSSGALVS